MERALVEMCKKQVKEIMAAGPVLIKYIRDENRVPVGVVVAYDVHTDNERRLLVGYSKCHSKKDTFSRYVGLKMAFDRACPPEEIMEKVPAFISHEKDCDRNVLREAVEDMIDRGQRYFKVG